MYHLSILIEIAATEDEQCRTVARKVKEAIQSATKGAPYNVRIADMKAKKDDPSPIVKPDSVSMVRPAVPRRTV